MRGRISPTARRRRGRKPAPGCCAWDPLATTSPTRFPRTTLHKRRDWLPRLHVEEVRNLPADVPQDRTYGESDEGRERKQRDRSDRKHHPNRHLGHLIGISGRFPESLTSGYSNGSNGSVGHTRRA